MTPCVEAPLEALHVLVAHALQCLGRKEAPGPARAEHEEGSLGVGANLANTHLEDASRNVLGAYDSLATFTRVSDIEKVVRAWGHTLRLSRSLQQPIEANLPRRVSSVSKVGLIDLVSSPL